MGGGDSSFPNTYVETKGEGEEDSISILAKLHLKNH